MSKLIKPSQYAKECGISRQAVYAKIKKGTLKAKKIDGQLFIELDNSIDLAKIDTVNKNSEVSKDLLAAKDETIKVLKETIEDLKATNNLIIGTLKGEVDLLKSAFNEMQIIYRNQIKQLQKIEPAELEYKEKSETVENSNDFVDIKDLARELNLSKKESKKFIKVAKKLQKDGDFRFVLVDEEIYALKNANYSDFLAIFKGFK